MISQFYVVFSIRTESQEPLSPADIDQSENSDSNDIDDIDESENEATPPEIFGRNGDDGDVDTNVTSTDDEVASENSANSEPDPNTVDNSEPTIPPTTPPVKRTIRGGRRYGVLRHNPPRQTGGRQTDQIFAMPETKKPVAPPTSTLTLLRNEFRSPPIKSVPQSFQCLGECTSRKTVQPTAASDTF
eukprot:TRINITY_DN2066_c0_g1_i5.p1 TRINITY_DN2066_c0_g1~~TRINITY_DN2066_c0_g1_i5.p1  ORF type:complete len:187 (+),score=5.56 TRINITY_DN2066_c0_g1_i5:140-700(+)